MPGFSDLWYYMVLIDVFVRCQVLVGIFRVSALSWF